MTLRNRIFWLTLATIVVVSLALLLTDQRQNEYKRGVSYQADRAVAQALVLYAVKKRQGIDFDSGPCLTNDLLPNWVADLVHRPRQSIDDLPENQCQAYLEGRARHFVELDLEGSLVRIK